MTFIPGKIVLAQEYNTIDPNFDNVSLLLSGEGANGSTTIIDSSNNNNVVTAVGDASISTAIANPFGNSNAGVLAFDGTGDYLSVPASNNLILGDTWTIEAWWYLNVAGAGSDRNSLLLAGTTSTTGSLTIYHEGAGGNNRLTVRAGTTGSDVNSPFNSIIALQWQYIAVSCLNNIATIYINGVGVASGSVNGPVTDSVSRIGSINLSAYDTDGYISNLRITKGVARYTTNFTPPTQPFFPGGAN